MQEKKTSVANATDKIPPENRTKSRLNLYTERLSVKGGHVMGRESGDLKELLRRNPSKNIKL